ncbi:NADPH-hemoprotein reductase [Schizosaccharomyces osmophilus]|uniref:NADPH-hemoprotein reductase n=1 Tax=Schizosaccharomyces osmophilus TaxID=2545709 RepID=A0AAE9WFN9_9SCHI|nr:NADPH-hemoprotein reductase [Schizosaccharomyces osmophilus]WBW74784.1 NADPH-hemoprotein reductase [Schizosaccharomyces osmophilus]
MVALFKNLGIGGDSSGKVDGESKKPVPKRGKYSVAPGYSQLDWARKVSSGENLSTVDRPMKVSKDELKKHCTEEDCWISIKGKVYNVTPYLNYHPAGVKKIINNSGIDATQVFMMNHAWVNEEAILKNCFIGYLT